MSALWQWVTVSSAPRVSLHLSRDWLRAASLAARDPIIHNHSGSKLLHGPRLSTCSILHIASYCETALTRWPTIRRSTAQIPNGTRATPIGSATDESCFFIMVKSLEEFGWKQRRFHS